MKVFILDCGAEEEELEKFFMFLNKYNDHMPVDQKLRDQLSNHFRFRWHNNRNNFLSDENDRLMFEQLE